MKKRLIIIDLILIMLIMKLPVYEKQVDEPSNIIQEEIIEVVEEQVIEEEIIEEPKISSRSLEEPRTKKINYRVTSYHPGDGYASTTKTGSGKTINDFDTMIVAGKSVYTYQGKIVVATATKELLKSGYSKNGAQQEQDKHYFNYYDIFKIIIDGVEYEAIVLDSCGASMWKGEYRIDIFVPNSSNIINRSNVEIIY